MNFYGGTPLGYACCFSLKHAAKAMLDTKLITLDSPGARCEVSGFLPLHAVTANGLKDMYNWCRRRVLTRRHECRTHTGHAPQQIGASSAPHRVRTSHICTSTQGLGPE